MRENNEQNDNDEPRYDVVGERIYIAGCLAKAFLLMALGLGVLGFVQDFIL